MATSSIDEPRLVFDFLETSSFYTIASPVSIATPAVFTNIDSKIYDLVAPFFDEVPHHYPSQHRRGVFLLKMASSIAGVLARIPLLPLSLNFSPGYPYLGQVIASMNILAFSSYMIYSSKDMIDHAALSLKVSSSAPEFLCERVRKISGIVLSIVSGMAAQVPYFFLAWDYNQQKTYMVAFSALDVIPPVYSLYLTYNAFVTKTACSQTARKILKAKRYLSKKLEERIERFIKGRADTAAFSIPNGELPTNKTSKINNFISDLCANNYGTAYQDNPCYEMTLRKTSQVLGFALLSIQLLWAGFLAYKGVLRVTDNHSLLISTVVYVMICNIWLTRFVLIGSLYNMARGVSDCFSQGRSYNYLSDRLMPEASVVMRLICFLALASSFIPAYTLSSDFLSPPYSYVSTALYGLGLGLLNYLPLRSLLDSLGHVYIKRWGSSYQLEQVLIYNHSKHIKKIIDMSNELHFGMFLLKLSDQSSITHLLSKFDLTQEELYIFMKRQNLFANQSLIQREASEP